tara:strand:+ start:1537 stop:3687 length:2151 start_codon:yes stop_codon:yes gene_type:complete
MSTNQDFSNKILLAEFDFDGRTYYLGTEGFTSENYYQPIMTSASKIQIGSSNGGFMSVNFGNLTISNDPKEKDSPFNLHTGSFAKLLNNPNQLINVRVYWGKQKTALFEGTMYFSQMKEDSMTFILESQDFSQNALVERATDNAEETTDLGSPLGSGGKFAPSFTSFATDFSVELHNWSTTTTGDNAIKATFNEAHGLSVGQVLYMDFVPTDGTDNVDANIYANSLVRWVIGDSYIVPLGSIAVDSVTELEVTFKPNYPLGSNVGTPNIYGYWTLYNFPSEVAPWMFGKVEKEAGILQHPDVDDRKYWNPLKHNDPSNPILLYDDGVLVGTSDPADIDTTIPDSTAYWKLTFNKAELETFKVAYPVTAMFGNGTTPSDTTYFPALYVGDQVTVTGSIFDSLNGTFQVSSVQGNNQFTYSIYNVGDDVTNAGSDILSDNAPRAGKGITRFGNYFGGTRSPTEEFIYTRAITIANEQGVTNISGEALVTGVGRDGETLLEFFTWAQGQLEVTNLDTSLAPDLATKKVGVSVTSQIKVTDLMGKIAESTNHLCYVRDDTLHVIDLGYENPNFITVPSYEIVQGQVSNDYPISYVETSFSKKVVQDEEWPITVTDDNVAVRVDNVAVGSSQSVEAVSKVSIDCRAYLQAILSHKKKAKMTITLNDVNLDILIGSRIKFSREEEQISYDMVVEQINYDFKGMSTQFSGQGSISVIEREGIY